MSRRARRLLRRALLFVLALAVGGELGLRAWDRAVGRRTGSLYQYIERQEDRFTMRPGTRVVVPERYGDIEYRFNRDGYRDDDHDPETPGPRVVVLGDSVTFGLGVRQDAIYPALLEAHLQRAHDPGLEVVNLAIFAYHTRHELAALEEDGLKHRPCLVLLQLYMNDLALPPADAPQPPPTLRLRLRAAKNRLLFASNLYRRLYQAVNALTYTLVHDLRRQRFPYTLNHAEPRHKLQFLAEHSEDSSIPAFTALAAVQELVEAHGAPLAVLMTPSEVQLYEDGFDIIDQRVAAFFRHRDIAFIDALPALRRETERHHLFLDGVHLSPLGHRRVAELLAGEVESRHLLAACGEPPPAPHFESAP